MQAKIPDNISVRGMLFPSKSNGLLKTLSLYIATKKKHLQNFAVGRFAECEDSKIIDNLKDMHKSK